MDLKRLKGFRPGQATLKKRAYSKVKKRRGKHKRKKNIKIYPSPSYSAINTEESVDVNGLMLDMSQLTEGFVIRGALSNITCGVFFHLIIDIVYFARKKLT